MDIDRALARFEAVMADTWPTWFAQLQPGLDDAGVERLRAAVAPFLVPAQIEALYRWRNGGDQGLFAGWRMRPLDELITWYQFTTEELGSPRTWLPVFDDQIVNVVTLDIADLTPSDPSVWYGHTHDGWLSRLFDSISALLDVVCDAAEADALVEDGHRLGLERQGRADALDSPSWNALRLSRCPTAFQWPDPPPGTHLSRFAAPDWPREWLLPLGVTEDSLTLRGPTHTIADLISAASAGPVRAIIHGQVVTGSGGAGWWNPVVRDDTGDIIVACDTTLVPLAIGVGQQGEFEVLLESAESPEPIVHDDPRVATVANRLRPSLPTARALAARPIPEDG